MQKEALKTNTGGVDFLKLRVIVYRDDVYNAFVAQCLQTGSVATADDLDTAKEMISELLEDELSYAIEHQNFENLFSTPAPAEMWVRWYQAAKAGDVEVGELKIDAKELRIDEQEVGTRVEVARVA